VRGAILLAAGIVFTVASSWWLALNGSSRTQESFLARGDGPGIFWCIRQHDWGVTRWATTPTDSEPLAAPVGLPSWVMPGVGRNDICETDAFGWPMRAMYQHRVLTRWGIGYAPRTSDSYEVNVGTRDYHRFPLGRIWIGLVVDAASWGLAFGLLWLAVLWLRAFVARRRGLCVECGYDRRGLATGAVCPECGTATSRRGAAA
jgi:hypothetical protein